MTTFTLNRVAAVLGTGLLALTLAACASGSDTGTAQAATSTASPVDTDTTGGESAESTQLAGLTLVDGWVKAADSGMSAAFGVLENPTDADLAVVGVSSPVSSQMQLHETVVVDGAMKMQQVDSFTVPAGGTFVLEPGGNHLMFMDLTTPVAPGDDVDLTLDLADGSTYSVTVQAREFTGADEEYVGGEMNGMDMHEDDHAEH
ncbi:MAG: hypothetical protein BGO96_05140 [Micrococcales bacterium 73-15]|uniref:copper chaperone PCu(A)C n=1 Tax=Salana multivorans TaxID=120377 RepID=UPI0009633EEE|nr:copper chaperone PCu(A)C [Salana multivorans]OJX97324.1 MAG: hypothetical protein BGO96_05140 [Micrococcales bacterium 73-15]